jgi:ATP-binding cassette, subfamily B, bacterial
MSTLRSYLRLASYAARYRRSWFRIVGATLGAALVGLLQPWPMTILVDQVFGREAPQGLVAAVLSYLPGGQSPGTLLLWIVGATVLLFLLNSLLDVILTLAWIRTGQALVYDLAHDLYGTLQRRSLLFHSRASVGDLLSRITGDTWSIYTLASALLITPAQAAFIVVMTVAVMTSLEPQLTLLALAVAPLMAFTSYHFGRPIKEIAAGRREVEARIQSHVQRTMRGIPVIKAFGQEDRESARFQSFAEDAIRMHRRGAIAAGYFDLGGGLVPALGTAAVLWFGALRVLEAQLTVGQLLVFLAYLATLQVQFRNLIGIYATLQGANASVDRVMGMLDAEVEVSEMPGAPPLPAVRGEIEFRGVSFGYDEARPVLRDVSLRISAGETVALVGSTGAGKTTLASLVSRTHDPSSGAVLLDGIDIRTVALKSLRQQIAVVPQEVFLFPTTVAENIAYGRPDAAREEIVAAATAANAHEFICRLPAGYDTVLSPGGGSLSGGERQRMGIARAVLKNAPILVLDEPTSALDGRTEHSVMEALQRLMHRRTTLIIAHRFSTILNADRIAVLEGGRIAECGSHDELLAFGGLYRRLHAIQFAERLPAARA